MRSILLIAHRGESFDAPENTLASFALAWARGDDAIELDVHLTKDRHLIVSHDPDTLRTAGEKCLIADHTLAQLKRLEVGAWKNRSFTGETMPALDEVLSQMPAGKRAFVEIKVGPEAIEPLAATLARIGRPARDVAIISFNPESVRAAKQRLPDHEAHLLVSQKQDQRTMQWLPTTEQMIAQARDIRADGLDLACVPCVNETAIGQIHAAGLKALVWTVDDPDQARRLMGAGIDAITTNRAAWMREQLVSVERL